MELQALYSKSFAGLEKYSLKFQPGANVFYGINEKGKSSVLAFLYTMLYGFSKDENGKLARKRYKPRSGKPIEGNLWFFHNGRNYELFRYFGDDEKEDRCYLIDLEDNQETVLKADTQPGELLFSIPKELFLQSFFVPAEYSERDVNFWSWAHQQREIPEVAEIMAGDSDDEAKDEAEPANDRALLQSFASLYQGQSLAWKEQLDQKKSELDYYESRKVEEQGLAESKRKTKSVLHLVSLAIFIPSAISFVVFLLQESIPYRMGLLLLSAVFTLLAIVLALLSERVADYSMAPLAKNLEKLQEDKKEEVSLWTKQYDQEEEEWNSWQLQDTLTDLLSADKASKEDAKAMLVHELLKKQNEEEEPIKKQDEEEELLKKQDEEEAIKIANVDFASTSANPASTPNTVKSYIDEIQLDHQSMLKLAGNYMQILSRGGYKKVEWNDQGEFFLYDKTYASFYPISQFSSGTRDQLYLSIRLAMIDLLDEKQDLPLLLDDVFMNFDDKRITESLQLMSGHEDKKPRQILLFTCHKRVEKLASETLGWTVMRLP